MVLRLIRRAAAAIRAAIQPTRAPAMPAGIPSSKTANQAVAGLASATAPDRERSTAPESRDAVRRWPDRALWIQPGLGPAGGDPARGRVDRSWERLHRPLGGWRHVGPHRPRSSSRDGDLNVCLGCSSGSRARPCPRWRQGGLPACRQRRVDDRRSHGQRLRNGARRTFEIGSLLGSDRDR